MANTFKFGLVRFFENVLEVKIQPNSGFHNLVTKKKNLYEIFKDLNPAAERLKNILVLVAKDKDYYRFDEKLNDQII